jgi:uncharacterized membrane protein
MAGMTVMAFLRFEQPAYLWLLALVPLLIVLSVRSLAGLGRGRRALAIALRSLVVTLLVLALAGASRTKVTDELAVLFVLDRSNSVPAASQRDALERIRAATREMGPDDRVGVLAFDRAASVEQLPMSKLAIDRVGESLAENRDHTNIAGALRLALALFPPNTARRVVLLSDGNENAGMALREADNFRAANVPIDVIPIEYQHDNEIVFDQLRTPPTATLDETINVQMIVRAQRPASGRILLYQNDQLVDFGDGGGAGFPVELEAGPNRIVRKLPLRSQRVHRFRAVFRPDDPRLDTIEANNEGRSFTVVSGPGRVLLLTTTEDMNLPHPSAQVLQEALRREKLDVDLELAGSQPIDAVRLLEYSLVILANVPQNDLTPTAIQSLASYVRDTGGGLIMLGGDQSFGAGGWMDTPIEDVLPVSCEVKNKKRIPRGALVLVMHACEVPNGNFIGERCAVSAIKTLSTRDLIGVLSYRWINDAQGFWDVPLQTVANKTAIIQKVMNMQMGDMPDLHEVMEPGVRRLIEDKTAAAKHMIVISDFDPSPPSPQLLADMKQHGITCSTIAIGYGGHMIDEALARRIAESTGGKFYATDKFDQLPAIFIKEARIVQRSLIQETEFTPQLVNAIPSTVRALAGDSIPALGGYVLTTPKPTADVPLVRTTEEGKDPILAHWQVGLGKTIAFTSGMWSRWGNDWANWPRFSAFWGQLARWASRQSEGAGLDVATSVQGGVGRIRVEAVDQALGVGADLTLNATLVRPDQSAVPLRLTQVGPGKFEGEFDASDRGNYVVNLDYRAGHGAAATAGSLRTGVSVAYSPEFEELATNRALLEEIRSRAGGRELSDVRTANAFDRRSLPKVETRRPIWEDLVRWMLVIFLLDVAVRRVAISPVGVWRAIRQRIAEWGSGGRRTAEASATVLTSLKGTRDRTRAETPSAPDAGLPPSRGAKYEAPTPGKVARDLADALGGAAGADKPVVAPPTRHKPPAGESDYTSRLLRAKRKAQGQGGESDAPDENQ